jgi:hypothetical protein
MLETNGIPPKLTNQVCEELICQQYWYRGKLAQEVDVLSLRVNGRWHQLYFENGIVFWRYLGEAPKPFEQKSGDPFQYPLINLGEQLDVKNAIISDYATDPLVEGVQVSISFYDKGSLVIRHVDNKTSLRFIH